MAEKNFALGSPTNDFLDSPRHFLSPKFRLFWRKWSFSTATPDCNTYQSNVPERFSLRPRSGHWWPSKSQSCPRQLRAIETILVIVRVLEYKRSGTPWPGKDVVPRHNSVRL